MSVILKRIIISMVAVAMMYIVGVFFVAFVEFSEPVYNVADWDKGARFFFAFLSVPAIALANYFNEV